MTSRALPIAVVGVSALYPGALTTADFWRDVLEGRNRISDVPRTHWLREDYFDGKPGTRDKLYTTRGGFLDPVAFSPMDFGMPPTSLPATDTAQLLALVVAKRLLAEATRGSLESIDRSRASVVLGVASATELVGHMAGRLQIPVVERSLRAAGLGEDDVRRVRALLEASYTPWQEDTFPGLLGNVVAGRIANRFDLGGTNAVVDAACASSLAAIDVAVNELTVGRSDLVVTGGVDALNDILMFMCFAQTGALSRTGDCRPFSADADGTLLGEGIGMLALKRLADAEREGDPIYAVIRGIGSSSDGRGKSIYAPVAAGQAVALRRAYERAGYGPETVGLVEGHGTATAVGDAVEIEALTSVWRAAGARERSCALGSIKAQFGHTKAAAGAAGLIKIVLALHHKVLPKTTKASAPNPALETPGPLYLNTELRPWVHGGDLPRRASVSAFGFGGTNFHATVEEYRGPSGRPPRIRAFPTELILLGASDQRALAKACRHAAEQCDGAGALVELARNTQLAFDAAASARVAILATDEADAARALLAAAVSLDKGEGERLPKPRAVHFGAHRSDGEVAFLFPGQGSQYVGMGSDLAVHFEAARGVWDESASAFAGSDMLAERVFPIPAFADAARRTHADALVPTAWAQPAIMAASLSMLRVVQRLLVPACTAGHSLGEITALAAAGAFDDKTAVAIARRRGELMVEASNGDPGSMLAVMSDRGSVEQLLAKSGIDVMIANDNAPRQIVLSGATSAIAAAELLLKDGAIQTHRLAVSAAFHSPLVQAAVEPFGAFLAGLDVREPRVPVFANATAGVYASAPDAIRAAMARAVAAPVRFREQIEAMYAAGVRTFVEIGPDAISSRLVERCLEGRPHLAVAVDQRGHHGVTSLLDALGRLSVAGVAIDFSALWEDARPSVDPGARATSKFSVALVGANYGKPWPLDPAPPREAPPREAPPRGAPAPPGAALAARPSMEPVADVVGSSPAAFGPPSGETASWLAAIHELQAPIIAAQREYQRLMAESQIAFLRATAGPFAGLAGQLPASLPPAPSYVEASSPTVDPSDPLRGPAVAVAAAPATVVAAAPATASDVLTVVLEVVAEKTGYPAEMIHLDMDLEGDLGIDSIKRVEILSAVRERMPGLKEIDAARMSALRTLGEIATTLGAPRDAALAPAATAPAATAPSAASVPRGDLPAPTLVALVLAVVAEKTGYPAEMIQLDMDLEADLGIDSIKRVEILSAVRERAPHLPELDASRLASFRSLAQIVSFMGGERGPTGGHRAPTNGATTHGMATPSSGGSSDDVPLARHVVRAVSAPAAGFAMTGLFGDEPLLVVGQDALSRAVVERLVARSVRATASPVAKPDAVGVLFLGGLRPIADHAEALEIGREAFRAARTVAARLASHGGVFVTVQDTGGDFGLSGRCGDRAWLASLGALAKSAAREWPNASVRAIDLERGDRTDAEIADALVDELLGGAPDVEVGLGRDGTRVVIDTAASPATADLKRLGQRAAGAVFVATGGARGVTAASLLRLAEVAAPRLVLLGRTLLVDDDPAYASVADDAALKRRALDEARRLGLDSTPRAIGQRVDAILAAREVRVTLAKLAAAGVEARYVAVDVRDRKALDAVLDDVRRSWGPIRGIVHGAGVLADALIEKKSDEQFARVFDTKVLGLKALFDATASDPVEWLCLFSSVAARTGNPGQVDYAMANEVLNKVAAAEALRRGESCRVVSIGWGPWHGGMVNGAVEKQFEARGVPLLPLDAGADAFVRELGCARDVEVVIGAGQLDPRATHGVSAEVVVDAERYPQLASHRVQGKVVVPAVLPVEWFVRLASRMLGSSTTTEIAVKDLRVLRGIQLPDYGRRGARFRIVGERSLDGASVSCELCDEEGARRYVATLERAAPARTPARPQVGGGPPSSRSRDLYGPEGLFHGPDFQVIRSVDVTTDGARAELIDTRELGWGGDEWITNPAAMDGALQLAFLVGLRSGLGPTLPMRIARIDCAKSVAQGPLACDARVRDRSNERLVCDMSLIQPDGAILADLVGVELYAVARGTA